MKEKWYKKINNCLTIIGYVVLIPILIFNLTIIYKSIRYPDKIPDVLGYKFFIVLSGSMETTIDKGDLVITKIVDPDSLNKNDIIAFRNGDIVVTHRIVAVNKDEKGDKYYVTKGDNVNTEDEDWVRNYNVEGKFVKKYKGLGNFLLFIGSPTGVIIIILLILVIFFAGNTIYQNINMKKDKEELKKHEKREKK